MAYGIVHFFPGRTKEQYEASIAAVHPSRKALYESKESWEHFRDEVLMPQMKKGINGVLTGPPQETASQIHNLQKPHA
jgi:hypothetical protein